jgi:uncharacterized protein (TIGR03435 family)
MIMERNCRATARNMMRAISEGTNRTSRCGRRSSSGAGSRPAYEAASVKPFQLTGPGWMETVCFDIAAKYPPDPKNEDRPLMLRTLLEDRFQLAVHRESKDMAGYALMVAKSGFKLKPVEPGGSDTSSDGGRVQTLTAKRTSMTRLADLVACSLGEIVLDKRGIGGVHDFELRWTKDDQTAKASKPPRLRPPATGHRLRPPASVFK